MKNFLPRGYNFDHHGMRELSEVIADMEIHKKALCTSDQEEECKQFAGEMQWLPSCRHPEHIFYQLLARFALGNRKLLYITWVISLMLSWGFGSASVSVNRTREGLALRRDACQMLIPIGRMKIKPY